MDATQKEVFDIENLLFERLLTFKPAWENKNIDLVGSFAVNVFAIANQIQITRILDQMLLRAINRSPKGGEVYVELKADQEYVRIAVSDNGNMDDTKPLDINYGMASESSTLEYGNTVTVQLPRGWR